MISVLMVYQFCYAQISSIHRIRITTDPPVKLLKGAENNVFLPLTVKAPALPLNRCALTQYNTFPVTKNACSLAIL